MATFIVHVSIQSMHSKPQRTQTHLIFRWMIVLIIWLLQGCVGVVDGPVQTRPTVNVANSFRPDPELRICPGMRVSNAPANTNRVITDYNPVVTVSGVRLLVAPVKGACLSSGFGPRGSGTHKGVDYHQRPGGYVYSAGSGRVLEMLFRHDYGNMVLIDHGRGVYTRYAHLKQFSSGLTVGTPVAMGTVIGVMGSSGRTSAVHLHFELLTGNYRTAKRSFGLTPRNLFN